MLTGLLLATLLVQTGQAPVMPAVVDSSLDAARRIIAPHRLQIKTFPVAGPPESALLVVRQNPQPGAAVTPDSVVTLWVNVISTRDFTGISEREADSIVRNAGFAIGARVARLDSSTRLPVIRRRTNVARDTTATEPPPERTKPRATARAPARKIVEQPAKPVVLLRDATPPDTPTTSDSTRLFDATASQTDTAQVLATISDTAQLQAEPTRSSAGLWPWLMVGLAAAALGVAGLIGKSKREQRLAEELAAHNDSLATIHYVISSDGTPIFRDTHDSAPPTDERAAD
jgi:hypothetical protein